MERIDKSDVGRRSQPTELELDAVLIRLVGKDATETLTLPWPTLEGDVRTVYDVKGAIGIACQIATYEA